MTHKISIIGAGAWGTALAQLYAVAGNAVTLYARDAGLASTINQDRKNITYLPSITLHKNITAVSALGHAVDGADVVIMATPTQYFRDVLTTLKPHLKPQQPIINTAKGIEVRTGKLLHVVTMDVLGVHDYALLSGPTFAIEVAEGLPAAATLASQKPQSAVAAILSTPTFRPYLSHDVIGAEIAGALKNVMAIATGIVDGKGLGQNAKAAIMTRGMAEIKRYGLKHGADADTFLGLSGIGDLTLTCNSLTSRNYSLGVEIGKGRDAHEILASRKSIAEGVTTAKAIAFYAADQGIDMPICHAVDQILHHAADVNEVIKALLARDLKHE